MALAFEQQERETDKAFAAFAMYLGLGPERSLAAVGAKLGKSKRLMEKWSHRFDWPGRVQAHGAHMAMVEREAAEILTRAKGIDWVKRQEAHRADEWQARGELVELARETISRWKKNTNKCGTLEGIARLLDLASKLGRLASGMPTDRTEVTAEVTGKIDIEWEIALKRVYGVPAAPASATEPTVVVDVEATPVLPEKEEAGVAATTN